MTPNDMPEELREIERLLDERRPARPDPETVQAVLAAASEAARAARSPDRPARPRRFHTRRWLTTGVVCTVALVMVAGYWMSDQSHPLQLETDASQVQALEGAPEPSALPSWDEPDDLRLIRWRIESLEADLRAHPVSIKR